MYDLFEMMTFFKLLYILHFTYCRCIFTFISGIDSKGFSEQETKYLTCAQTKNKLNKVEKIFEVLPIHTTKFILLTVICWVKDWNSLLATPCSILFAFHHGHLMIGFRHETQSISSYFGKVYMLNTSKLISSHSYNWVLQWQLVLSVDVYWITISNKIVSWQRGKSWAHVIWYLVFWKETSIQKK